MVDRDEILLELTWRYLNFLREKSADEFCENGIPRIKALATYDGELSMASLVLGEDMDLLDGEVYKRVKRVGREVTDGL